METASITDAHILEIGIFLIAQLIVIISAIVAVHVKTQVALAKLDIELKGVSSKADALKRDHLHLAGQVGGISRGLARLEGHVGAGRLEPEET